MEVFRWLYITQTWKTRQNQYTDSELLYIAKNSQNGSFNSPKGVQRYLLTLAVEMSLSGINIYLLSQKALKLKEKSRLILSMLPTRESVLPGPETTIFILWMTGVNGVSLTRPELICGAQMENSITGRMVPLSYCLTRLSLMFKEMVAASSFRAL